MDNDKRKELDDLLSGIQIGDMRPSPGPLIVTHYGCMPPGEWGKPVIPSIVTDVIGPPVKSVDQEPRESQADRDLADLLSAVDAYVKGQPLTEAIVQLRTKAAVIRDMKAQREGR